jgi:nitronate monooxygenase
MGVGVSNWRLARAVSKLGQLGVVSGTLLDQVLARRLQDGDPGGHMRKALDHFPFQRMAERIWNTYFIRGGKPAGQPYRILPMHSKDSPAHLKELCLVSNFVEVHLAREGHGNPVGINYLEKVQPPHLPSLYGAMLAGVSCVLMGAGIPLKIPGALGALARHEQASYPMHVMGSPDAVMNFAPRDFMEGDLPELQRPAFLAIIASNTLALTMLKKSNGKVDGFIVEGPEAGGHNAPPRGKPVFTESGEPIYGERDEVDLAKLRELGVPFWLGGGYGKAVKLGEALAEGAQGVQVGTAFAFCVESALREDYKQAVLRLVRSGGVTVFTDPLASPAQYPFKTVLLEDTVSDQQVYNARQRVCDLGYLRQAYLNEDGSIGYYCAAEPVSTFVAKGGRVEQTTGRKCLCNALLANIGLAQVQDGGYVEKGLITSGTALTELAEFLPENGNDFTAADVVSKLLG